MTKWICIRTSGESHPRYFRYVAAIPLLFAALSDISSAATVIGRVYSEDGNPVKKAFVTAQSTVATLSADSKTASSGSQYQSLTDEQGKFALGLPDGPYTICVRAGTGVLLDSCEWFLKESIIQAQPGIAPLKIVLRAGLIVRIRLNDPLGLWSPDPRVTSAASVRFTVYDALGYPHPVAEVSRDEKGRNFEALVPANQDYKISVQGRTVDVVDEKNSVASRSAATAIQSAKSDLAQTRVYEIVPLGAAGKGNGNANGKAK